MYKAKCDGLGFLILLVPKTKKYVLIAESENYTDLEAAKKLVT